MAKSTTVRRCKRNLIIAFKLSPAIFSAPDTFDSLFVVLGALVSRNRIVKAEPGGDEQLASRLLLWAVYEARGRPGAKIR
jgi:hypothetical protein